MPFGTGRAGRAGRAGAGGPGTRETAALGDNNGQVQRGDGGDGVPWETEQTRMVERLRRAGVAGPRVLAALARVPRDVFVDESVRHLAFKDVALPIEGQQTISQPTVVAMMTEALDAGPQDTVLEVGTGSGYQAAVLAELAGEVLTIERQPGLADLAARRLRHLGYRNAEVVVGDGAAGLPERAPFDAVLVAARPRGCPRR